MAELDTPEEFTQYCHGIAYSNYSRIAHPREKNYAAAAGPLNQNQAGVKRMIWPD